MKIPPYQWMGQMLAALGVIVSLVLVAYEMKQSRDIALADIYQQKTALIMDINMAPVESPELHDAYQKLLTSPEALESSDLGLLYAEFSAFLAYSENNHFLYQHGMITEEQMNTIWAMIADWLNDSELYRHYWITGSKSGSWRASFAVEVDDILAGLDPVQVRNKSYTEKWVAKERCLASGKCQAELRSN